MYYGFEESIVLAIVFEKISLGFVFKIGTLRAGEVTQWVRSIAAKPDGLSSGSQTHGVNSCRLSSLPCVTMAHACPPAHIHSK